MNNNKKIICEKKDEFIMFIIRLWFSGAIAFMFLFGANISFSAIDLVVYLTLIHYISERFIISWISKQAFKTKMNYWPSNEYKNNTLLKTVIKLIVNIIINFIIVIGVISTYTLINKIIIIINRLETDVVKFRVEPIMYSIFFNLYFYIYYFAKSYYYKVKRKRRMFR